MAKPKSRKSGLAGYLALFLLCIIIFLVVLFWYGGSSNAPSNDVETAKKLVSPAKKSISSINQIAQTAAIREKDQLHEIANDGIDDTVTAVVECSTSAGNLTIDVRSAWSPLGAAQFLKLVELDLFTDLPFTRVCPKYITQYGRKYRPPNTPDPIRTAGVKVIKDDSNLWSKRDMDFGYVFFAGSGRDSRYDEMVVALCEMKGCRSTGLGKADWETPVGTIRREGFPVLREIEKSGRPYPRLEMAGQHPKASGPNPSKLMQDKQYLEREYPFIQYWRGCRVAQIDTHISRPLTVDHPDSVQIQEKPALGSRETLTMAATHSRKNLRTGGDVEGVGGAVGSDSYTVEFAVATASNPAGIVMIEVLPEWAPIGAKRFKDLVVDGFFEEARFFRVIKGFMAQFGIASTPEKHKRWQKVVIKDDPVKVSNTRGTITFATSGKNSRTSQLFINFGNNAFLDNQGFAPIGRVIKGMDVIDGLYSGYGEGGNGDGTDGKGPSQGRIVNQGNQYLDAVFPRLSYVVKATLADEKMH